ncbi:hypothetical protein BIV23_00905 [Streptomyces monashensis]|uniref:Uncharacterized protein n=1 Tax=Streptomyces monashensis TaxID=1678012 RepID=A0A1S2QR75_9ACTN|nr:hypothetical protein BIV23_00905 [Streptomyces monashensis]
MRVGVDLVAHVLPHKMQLLAEVGQAIGESAQVGGTASGAVGATPLRGGFEHLVQPGHRTEVVRECLVEQLGEILGSGSSETVVPVDRRCGSARTHGRGGGSSVDSVVCSPYG